MNALKRGSSGKYLQTLGINSVCRGSCNPQPETDRFYVSLHLSLWGLDVATVCRCTSIKCTDWWLKLRVTLHSTRVLHAVMSESSWQKKYDTEWNVMHCKIYWKIKTLKGNLQKNNVQIQWLTLDGVQWLYSIWCESIIYRLLVCEGRIRNYVRRKSPFMVNWA